MLAQVTGSAPINVSGESARRPSALRCSYSAAFNGIILTATDLLGVTDPVVDLASTFSGFDASVIPGPMMVRAGVAGDNVRRAVASIDHELSRLANEGPADEELAESRQYLIGSMPRNLETNIGIASYLQMIEFFGLGLDYDVRVPDLLRAVTRDDVHAAARRTLDPARAAVVVAGPFDGSLE